jgi:proteasome alpha subunit
MTINYDGTFEEHEVCAVLAATPAIQSDMVAFVRRGMTSPLSLAQALLMALHTWALGDRAQRRALEDREPEKDGSQPDWSETSLLSAHLRETMADKTLECAVLDRQQPGPSKYRTLSADEVGRLLPADLNPSVPR